MDSAITIIEIDALSAILPIIPFFLQVNRVADRELLFGIELDTLNQLFTFIELGFKFAKRSAPDDHLNIAFLLDLTPEIGLLALLRLLFDLFGGQAAQV